MAQKAKADFILSPTSNVTRLFHVHQSLASMPIYSLLLIFFACTRQNPTHMKESIDGEFEVGMQNAEQIERCISSPPFRL
jgi:hypothetical protein